MKKSEELIKNTLVITIGKMGTQLVNFLLLPLYTARISTVDYGNYDFIVTIAAFVVPVMTLLLEESMFRFLVDCTSENDKEKVISHSFLVCIVNFAVISTLMLLFFAIFHYKLGFALLLFCAAMVIKALANALARGLSNIPLYSMSNFLSSLGIILLNLLLILSFNLGLEALIISNVVSNLVVSLFVLIRLKFFRYLQIRNIDTKFILKMLKFSLPMIPNSVSWAVINASDRLVIMGFSGPAATGIYSMAHKFPSLINTFYSYFNIAWRETAAKIVRDGDQNLFSLIYHYVSKALLSITLLLITGLHIIYPLFMNGNYESGLVYVPLLAISVYYSSLAGFFGGISTGYKKTGILASTSFIAALINLVIDLALYKYIGLYAAALSTLVASIFLFLYRRYKIKKYFKIKDRTDYLTCFAFIAVIAVFYFCTVSVNTIVFVAVAVFVAWYNRDVIKCFLAYAHKQARR